MQCSAMAEACMRDRSMRLTCEPRAWLARSSSMRAETTLGSPPGMPMDSAPVPCVRRLAMRDAWVCSPVSALAAHVST